MNVSEYIASFLEKKGIKDVFLIDGSAIASIVVAVARNGNLTYYCPQHEQAGSFAVDGYYKASGKLSAMLATSGPGGQNLLNGIAAAYYDSSPAFFITGNINSKFMKPSQKVRQHGFQENDIVAMAKPVTKSAVMVKRPEHIKYELEKAYHIATSGRPGPVLIDVPMDIQKATIDENALLGYDDTGRQSWNSEIIRERIQKCVQMVKNSERPVILVGGGVWLAKAAGETKRLIKKLKIPFFVTWNMIDFCEKDYFLYGGRVGTYGGDGRNFGLQNSDLLLSIGSRISGRITGGMVDAFARSAKKIIIDIDPEELRWQQVKGDLNIVCDAKVFVEEFLALVKKDPLKKDFSPWVSKVIGWKKKYPVFRKEFWGQKGNVNPYVFVKVLSEEMEEGAVLVHEAGGNCVVTSQTFEAKSEQRVFSNNGNSSLGYALPAAIGASIATQKPVVCIVGDGGMNFNIQELQTIKYYNLPVKIFIFNNYAFGITKAYRDTHFQSEYAGVDAEHGQSNPNFRSVAEAYGIKAVHIKKHKEVREKVRLVLNSSEPIVCDVNMAGFYDYQPKLGWKNPIEDQYPFLSREEFRKNMIIEPVKGWENPQYP